MYQWVYAQPLRRVCAEIVFGLLLWAVLSIILGKRKPKLWQIGNYILLAVSVFAVVFATLLHRTPGKHELILIPGYFLKEAQTQPEIYRALLMNVLLFTPFGLTLSAVLSKKRTPWKCVLLTVLIGIALSLSVETAQYLGGLGRAEVDDLLANTLGTFIGALHVPLGAFFLTQMSILMKKHSEDHE